MTCSVSSNHLPSRIILPLNTASCIIVAQGIEEVENEALQFEEFTASLAKDFLQCDATVPSAASRCDTFVNPNLVDLARCAREADPADDRPTMEFNTHVI